MKTETNKTGATVPQGWLVTPKSAIAMGRVKAHHGQTFWVTDSVITRAARGAIAIARSGRNAGYAIHLSIADFDAHFDVLSDF